MVGAMLETGRTSFADRYLTGTCVAAAAALAVALADSWAGGPSLLAAVFAGAMLVAVRAPVLTHARGDGIAITVEEVFLVPALVLLHPSQVVVATAIGVAAGMTLGPRWSAPWVRRRYFSPRRVLFNVGQKTLSAAAAAGIVLVLGGGGTGASVAAATAAAAVYALVSRTLVAVMIASVGEEPLGKVVRADLSSFAAVSLILWAGGALVALAATRFGDPAIWVGLTVVAVLWGSAVSNRTGLQRERIAGLLEAAQRISRAGPEVARVRSELEWSARSLLDCRAAALQDHDDAGGGVCVQVLPGSWLRVGDPRGTEVTRFEAADVATLEALATIAAPALEHARAIEQLREADDLKAAVIGSVSHDIRNPLYTAVGIADVLADAPELPEETRTELVAGLRSSVGRVARLVEGMLDLQRYELGRLPEPADAEVAEVVDRVAAALDDGSRVTVTGDNGIRARIDAPTLERVIENLVSNALRHGPDGEPVEVTCRHDGERVVVVVDDAGPGVPEDRREAIFEPFRSGSSGGVGLGLWVARRFIELRDGRIWVETSARGGASFRVELPPASDEIGPYGW